MQQFRFAAIESVEIELRPKATAVVLLGGLISAFLGTEIATLAKITLIPILLALSYPFPFVYGCIYIDVLL